MKRTYVNRLPKNEEVKNANVRIENGELVVEVEFEEKFEPKDGDFLSTKDGRVFIYNNKYTSVQYGAYCGIDIYNDIIISDCNLPCWTGKEGCRFATTEEKSDFLARLEKEYGKRWNAEKKCLEDIRWRAKKGETYYCVDNCALVTTHGETFDMIDNIRYDLCNYFRYYESAQKVADQIKDIFKNSKAE